MSIRFDQGKKVFLLDTPSSTYIIRIFEDKYLLHGGWFNRIRDWSGCITYPMVERANAPVPLSLHDRYSFSLDTQNQEFPLSGHGDYRSPALEVRSRDGTIASDAEYTGYRILKGKKDIPGLPHTYVNDEKEADTLEIDLFDKVNSLKITLVYTVWNTQDVICRSVILKNESISSNIEDNISLNKIMSLSMDFTGSRYQLMTLSGSWARERHPVIRDLYPGFQGVDSKRVSSSHQHNPFMALMEYGSTESSGTVYGFSFVYSGNFTAGVEVDQFGTSRVQMGINPYNFEWNLKSGESFYTPEVVMVYSNKGLGQMSRTYHDLYRNNLCRGKWSKMERPIVINNWEATYFNFNEEKLFALADTAAKEGIELFVLDDGWFGKRNDDRSSLGDWYVNTDKLKNGLKGVSKGIHDRGMKFGLWFEPEMISMDSDLYRKHPDWALTIEGRYVSLSRHQLVLDLSRDDVVDYLIDTLSNIFDTIEIDYVKWDFNRNLCEVYSHALESRDQLSVGHRYYLGLYRLMETLTQKYQNILFESCAGGGARFDPGMLYYMSQTWTSDDTDAVSRVTIQMGTSIVYPSSSISCHVSAVPNHQIGRITPLSQRASCAMAGTYGYELDLNKLTEEELKDIKKQCDLYKKIRKTVQYGDLYRLNTPWQKTASCEVEEFGAWNIVSKDKKQGVFTVVWTRAEANPATYLIKWQGLDPNGQYRLTSLYPLPFLPMTVSGEELMNIGMYVACSPLFNGNIQIVADLV